MLSLSKSRKAAVHGNSPAALQSELISQPFGATPNVNLRLTCREITTHPTLQELSLAFQILDSLLLSMPFEQWEN